MRMAGGGGAGACAGAVGCASRHARLHSPTSSMPTGLAL